MMPITPSGTLIFVRCSPDSIARSSKMRPSGEGKLATFFISAAMSLMRSAFKSRRSYFGFDSSMRARSSVFAAKIFSVLATM